jgi:hypothetical protein
MMVQFWGGRLLFLKRERERGREVEGDEGEALSGLFVGFQDSAGNAGRVGSVLVA